jgi:hypothetical protein
MLNPSFSFVCLLLYHWNTYTYLFVILVQEWGSLTVPQPSFGNGQPDYNQRLDILNMTEKITLPEVYET